MLNMSNFLLLSKDSILITSYVNISEQYLEYYAKDSVCNLKGSKSKVTFHSGTCNFLYAEQFNTSFCNKKSMQFTGAQTSDPVTTLA